MCILLVDRLLTRSQVRAARARAARTRALPVGSRAPRAWRAQRIVKMGWTMEERLVVIFASGLALMFSLHSSEMVALSGGHTLGKSHGSTSGMPGTWDQTPHSIAVRQRSIPAWTGSPDVWLEPRHTKQRVWLQHA